jgi:hypothetical protein
MISKIKIEYQMIQTYTCAHCGKKEPGSSSVSGTFTGSSIEDVVQELQSQRPHPNNMPIGWTSYLYGIYCPKCEKEKKI